MKNKLIVICIIFSIFLAGCGKKNKQDVTEPTSDTTISTTEGTQEEQEKEDISIFTKEMEISYEKFISKDGSFENDEKYNNMVKDFIAKLDEDKLPQLTKDEEIRIDFNNLEKIKKAQLFTTKIKQDKDYEFDIKGIDLEIDKNGFANFKHSYDDKDKYLEGVIYEVTVELEDEVCKYAFAFKIDNKTAPNNKSYALTGYLTSDEQKVYDSYKQDKNIKVLSNNEPLTMLKFYTQAVMEEEYSLAYSLYYNNMTEENYIKVMKSFSKELKEDYISNLKAAVEGKFIEDTKEKGYIEYELVKDHPMAIDMIKDSNGIWKTQYMPIQ